jgi:lipopolysaccharide assembly outer membrane protein LptD (OstA)
VNASIGRGLVTLAIIAFLLAPMTTAALAQTPVGPPAPPGSTTAPPGSTTTAPPGSTTTAVPTEPQQKLNVSADNVSGSRGPEGDMVNLNGHVRITRASTVITSEAGRYFRSKGMLYLDNRVKLVDSTTTITCDHASFSEDRDVLEVNGHVVITDRDAVLRAPTGVYDRKNARAELFGGVSGADSSQTMTSDHVIYYRDQRRFQALGHVVGEDLTRKMTLSADSVDYDRVGHLAVARGNPVLRAKDRDNRTAEIHGRLLKVNNELRIAEAIDSVHVVRDTLQARADYALFDDKLDHGWLLGHPRAWDDETVVSGDTLEVWTEKRVLRRFTVRKGATIDYVGARPDSRGEASRLTGDRIDVFFSRNQMDSLVAVGKARNDYRSAPHPGKTSETNTAHGDTITMYFKDRKIERAVVQGSAEGEYHFEVAKGDTAAAKTEVVTYDAPRIEFIVPKNHIVLDQRSHLLYKELELHAKRVEFDSEKQTLVAEGNPKLVDRGDEVTGHLMTYDLESRTGTIYQAETMYEKALYHGEAIRKVGDNELEVKNGSYSTCTLDPPHYRFASNQMKVYLRDKLVARPVVFYIKNVPILALPFYVFPIKPGRHSGFLLPQTEFGFNQASGRFIRNGGYYWAPNDYYDLTLAGDYYQNEPSWRLRSEANYKLLYKFEGNLSGTYTRSTLQQRDQWDFNSTHTQEISPRTHLVANASFVSSREYQRDPSFGNPLSQTLNRFLTSNLSVSHYADWANFNFVVDRRQDLDADQALVDPDGPGPLPGPPPGTRAPLPNLVQSVPSISVSFPTRTLGTLPFVRHTAFEKPLSSMYFSLNTRYIDEYSRTGFLDSASVIREGTSNRWAVQTTTGLSDSRRLFGWLNMAPGIFANTVVWDQDLLGNHVVPSGTWNAQLTASSTFYGTFTPKIGRLVGLRHVIFPSVQMSYSPEFPQLTFTDSLGFVRNRFVPFNTISVSGFRSERMTFSVQQILQAKLKSGDLVQRLDNLLRWTVSGAYDFLWRENHLPHPLTPLTSTVNLQPPGFIQANASSVIDVYSDRPMRSLSYDVSMNLTGKATTPNGVAEVPLDQRQVPEDINFNEPWSLSLAYSYSGGYGGPTWFSNRVLNAVAHYPLTRAWRLDYLTSYDVTNNTLRTQQFGLTRDLHCWQASFTRTFTPGFNAEYYFKIGIKEQKEVFLEQGTRGQSLGNIR